ncbi:hypothetical protein [Bacillus toyonensis]|uniref:Uncharacterized protein n=1 Tax=Bacillus toyonensis TaxID=155322 RepID=A0AB36SNS1_9BACI|nr:hypothetical protein [Bacillus toyonensis]MCU4969267.1 hypothetical protein [Bacillus toyonensis]PEJ86586.1 hypothetical protein CN891_15660 [Bacillus toyonensis]PEN55161.1 hypothetical protein CN596_11320 [Bacillus toyonensis]PGE40350.1 hypothetical protein COM60_06935 [Bacillus toyonensis]PGE73480.1 hypothetical protein COM58_21510 [Bacillus toyonensis]
MKKLDRFTKPYFETRGDKENGVYEVIRYKNDEFIPFKEKFDSLKKARMFIYRYVLNNPEWLNVNGDISEFNFKDGRDEKDNKWHDNVSEKVYKKKYKDFKDWKK